MAWRPQVHRSPGSARRSLMPCGLVGCGSSQSGCPVGPLARRGGPLRESKWVLGYLKRAVVAANETIARMPEDGRPGELPADLRFYDLRHTCASLLIREGGSIKAVQKQMGHKTAAITLDTYGHLYPDELPGLAERFERAPRRGRRRAATGRRGVVRRRAVPGGREWLRLALVDGDPVVDAPPLHRTMLRNHLPAPRQPAEERIAGAAVALGLADVDEPVARELAQRLVRHRPGVWRPAQQQREPVPASGDLGTSLGDWEERRAGLVELRRLAVAGWPGVLRLT